MSRRSRILLITAGTAVALVLLLVIGALVVLRTVWLRDRVRERIVAEVERATGGRSEAGAFSFDWRHLTAEVRGFVLHGTEPPGKPPLFQARSIRVGLKIVSLFQKKVNIEYLGIDQPHIYLIVYPGGRTNVPAPKVRRTGGKPIMQTILDLAVRRIGISGGLFELEGQGTTPFQLTGRNLEARLAYDFTGPRYAGNVSMRPFDVQWGARRPLPVDVSMAVDIRAGQIQVPSGRFVTGASTVDFSGAVARLAPFDAAFDYQARVSLPDLERILEIKSPPSGNALVSGRMTFAGISNYDLAGNLNAVSVAWRQDPVRLSGFRAEGAVSWTPARLEASGLRLAGTAYLGKLSGPQAVNGRIEKITLRSRDLNAAGVRLALMGGSFAGAAQLREWRRYHVSGDVAGLEARRLLALYSRQNIPWDGLVSGPVLLEGDLRRKSTLAASARVAITPAESGPPVRGAVEAAYSALGETLDLGRSWLQLPSTRVDFSGVLGRRLDVRLESRNLDDLLPALDVKSLPVRLENGTAGFQGTVTGKLDDPHIAGHVALARFAVNGTHFDAFQSDVAVSRTGLQLRGASAAHGTLRAQFQADAALRGWKLADGNAVYADGTVRNAAVADLLAIAGRKDIPVTGTLDAAARLTGTYDSPQVALDVTAVKGSLYGEPFDRFTAKGTYASDVVEIASAGISAGAKQVSLRASYRHQPGNFTSGRLRFDTSSNALPLAQFETVHKQRPDLTGTAQFDAAGLVDVSPSNNGQPAFRVISLSGHATAGAVAVNGQQLGDLDVRAGTAKGVLTAYLTSNFAGSAVRGDGTFKLVDDYSGTARVTFSRLDFVRLRQFFSEPAVTRVRVAGSMSGDVTLSGPIAIPERWKAAINIAELQLGPTRDITVPGKTADFTLHNAGPVTATMANGVLKVERARFVGRATDLTLAGSVAVQKANALDLRLKGRVDLATLQDLDRDITASGFLNTDATIRGRFDDPQVNGRLEVKDAAFNLAGFPNGIYNANGALVFTGTRANIQNLTGESGGGKVRVAGFVGYEADQFLFRLFLRAEQVRVRYPEGVSTVANAALNWTGDVDRSTLAGTITIVRTGFNPHSDFSSILAQSAEPVRTPSTSGLLSGLHFDVQIETSPDITFQSSLAQDIQMEANLRLRGTGTNPSLLGRINITQGRLVFFGTRYTINQGSVSFFNPSRIEPVLNVDLETRARGIDVTLTVSGPLKNLNLTPRSDPPLQLNEIITLLATGRAPTTQTNTQISQSPAGAQSWQQMGASALLGQAVANPVAGRLQRFFGVTRLKIDPSLAGVEYNPQARVTLEQQITPNITFTYITNVTSSNPLVVQVEWAISRKWSVIAVKDENGQFGLDFLYKKRF